MSIRHNPYISPGTADLLVNINTFSWLFVVYFNLWFAMIFTGRLTKGVLFSLSLSLILPVTILFQQISYKSILRLSDINPVWFGFSAIYSDRAWVTACYTYVVIFCFIHFIAVYKYYVSDIKSIQKKPIFIVLVTSGASIIIGILFDVIVQEILNYGFPGIADIAGLIYAAGTYYAISRYNLFAYTPALAASKIIDTISDSLFIIDDKNDIRFVNKAAEFCIGMGNREIIGENIEKFLNSAKNNNENSDDPYGPEGIMKTSHGGIPVHVNSAILYDHSRIIGKVMLARDISELKLADENLKNSLNEKEVLLREIHHRVKNNLQIVYSLLNLQINTIVDKNAREKIIESQNRIRLMSLIHEKLYQSESLAKINAEEYIGAIANELYYSLSDKKTNTRLCLDIESIEMTIDMAIPCGLIVNELMTNAIKYAFPEGWKGEGKIEILLRSYNDEHVEIKFTDNGVGIPANIDINHAQSLGLQLVNILVKNQLKGSMEIVNKSGLSFIIRFSYK
jgi:PAS domain S-box-containing protein